MSETRPLPPGTPFVPVPVPALAELDPDLLRTGLAIRDWLLSVEVRDSKGTELVADLARRLNDVGIPADRVSTAIDALHSEYSGIGRI